MQLDSYWIRKIILGLAYKAHVGHIGSALSVADILVALYSQVLNLPSLRHPERDRFILSNGHAAMALYAALYLKGFLSQEILDTFGCDDTLLGVHPERLLPGIDFCSGSLGQGISMGVGAALAARLQKSARRIFVTVSDGECNEGSLWEAAMFAAHHSLANLVVIIDQNGQQALDYTRNVLNTSPLEDRWRAFGWDVHPVDGHSVDGLVAEIAGLNFHLGPPHVLVAHTTFGKGVRFMENQVKWHYLPLSDADYRVASEQIEALCEQP